MPESIRPSSASSTDMFASGGAFAAEVSPRLTTTFDRAPVGIAHFDREGRFTLVNPQLCALFGYSAEELLATRFALISFPEDLPRCLALTAQLAAGTIPKYTVEKRFVRRDGSCVYVRVIVSAVRDRTGEVSFFLGIVEDLSEFWAAEEARRGAEERLRVGLSASATGIYRYDFQRQALDWANGLARVFGFSEDEPLQSLDRLLGVIHPEDLPAVLVAYERSATQGADFDERFRIVRPDGAIRWISDRARMTLDDDGKPRYLTGACVDVTDLVRVQQAERAARAEAERAKQRRDDMLAIVAHDLRNPVHTIMMSAGAMAEFAFSETENQRQLALIRRSAAGMDHLIRDLLDITQIESGRLSIQTAPISLTGVIEEAVSLCSAHASDAGLSVEVAIDSGLPEVVADRARIAQVLSNLLGNAVKFTPNGGRIAVGARHLEGFVEVCVEDTGRGMSADQLPQVFEAYWQAEPKTSKGVGLGMAIVRGILAAHRGTIAVESTLGVGTRFRFTLPVSD